MSHIIQQSVAPIFLHYNRILNIKHLHCDPAG